MFAGIDVNRMICYALFFILFLPPYLFFPLHSIICRATATMVWSSVTPEHSSQFRLKICLPQLLFSVQAILLAALQQNRMILNIYPWAVYCEGPPSFIWGGGGGGGEPKMRHCYSSLQLTYTFKTRTKHKKLRLCAFIRHGGIKVQ